MNIVSEIIITPEFICHDNREVVTDKHDLNSVFRQLISGYPKFFKMDSLCKLGFIGAELLLKDYSYEEKGNMAIILFNRSGSLITDRNYEKTIKDPENYFPSPSLFVYTLANIVTGEIAIRHKIYGESSFYILDKEDWDEINAINEECFLTSNPTSILTGWIEYEDENHFLANMKILNKNGKTD